MSRSERGGGNPPYTPVEPSHPSQGLIYREILLD